MWKEKEKLRIEGLTKCFGKLTALDDVNFTVEEGQFCIILGPSGCGKSTLLQLVAGLEEPDRGRIVIDGQVVNDLPPGRRDVAMVFQSYALYPHMTVFGNIAFPLKVTGTPKDEIEDRVREAAGLLSLEGLLHRYPRELSGGQRQRVAMGRAIVRRPKLFLFDEPLSNLDARLRVKMRAELAALHRRLGATILYVTHDQTEAMTLGEKVVILDDGRIMQTGTPSEVYRSPQNLFVARFIGSPEMNLFEGELLQGEPARFKSPEIDVTLPWRLPTGDLTVGIRPEDLSFTEGEGRVLLGRMKITFVENLGPEAFVHLECGRREVVMRCGPATMEEGKAVDVFVSVRNIHLFRGGKRVTPKAGVT